MAQFAIATVAGIKSTCTIEGRTRCQSTGRLAYKVRYYDRAGPYQNTVDLFENDVELVPYRPAPLN